jgi:hypothetical protein
MVPMTTVASAGAYLLSAPVALGPNESVGKLPTALFVRGYAYDESIICGWPIPRCRRVSQSTSHYLATMGSDIMQPNAAAQPRLEAVAVRTLEAVGSMPSLGVGDGRDTVLTRLSTALEPPSDCSLTRRSCQRSER